MTVYAKNHQSLHKIYKFGSVSKLLAMTVFQFDEPFLLQFSTKFTLNFPTPFYIKGVG